MLFSLFKDVYTSQSTASMQELTPSEVAMADSTAMMVWMMNFQLALFIFMVFSY